MASRHQLGDKEGAPDPDTLFAGGWRERLRALSRIVQVGSKRRMGGTLFLDEIGEIPLEMQSTLLRDWSAIGSHRESLRYLSHNGGERSGHGTGDLRVDYRDHSGRLRAENNDDYKAAFLFALAGKANK